MRSVASVLRLPGSVLALSRWGQACGGLAAHSRQLSSDSSDEDLPVPAELYLSGFDAAEEGAPVAVHQLIGDPRTGVADDTTTSPWGADVSMEWVWSHPASGVDWFRYSMAGPDQLPHMYMDARLSDHSKNLMYLLRCKDPQRWTIPELADKFRIRRQRVMAILALKEMQAHRLEQGQDMKGPLQPYVFRVPLQDFQGTDLRAALAGSSSDAKAEDAAASLTAAAAAAPGLWPGQVPPVVDVWGYEEVPRQQLAALQKQLPPLQQLLSQLQAACADLGSSSSSSSSSSAAGVDAADMLALQNAAQVYSGLVWEYDKVLGEQAAAATGAADGEAPPLPPQSQRRLMRTLRALDGNALEKLLLWESYLREEGWEGRSNPRARRLLRRVHAAIKALDAQAAEQGLPTPFAEYPDLPADVPAYMRVDKDMATAHLDAEVVGRQFHRGSGDRHYVRLQSYPSFEGYSLEEFDSIQEGELSTISRLAAEREDNMMWKEFRERLLRNIGLTAPDLYQHLNKARPPRPRRGWSYVVHPMGGASRALIKQQLREQKVQQWLPDDDVAGSSGRGRPGDLGLALDPARDGAPAEPYVAVPGPKERKMPGWKRLPAKPKVRGLNEEEEMVVGYSRAKPRRRWYASTRGMVR
ncbi:hypothetical protein OEZ85_008190 [Tetradesmus obliquus]|uniref:Uncharacterized protein n=1 Tax=Tetradesmus obliquus TaxID=3088 RepID=A0ABY8TI55_TETOB|nr:hypothetical protein OEZ85_008190 [Tetradesmus obliquus]